MLTKLRCLNDCAKVTAMITSLVQAVTTSWPDEIKNALLRELNAVAKLDWPVPAPNLRPPLERPKPAPLYLPRRSFIPELVKSVEELP